MKKVTAALFIIAAFITTAAAQSTLSLKKVMELKMPAEDENSTMNGTRGASVAWHPVQKKYYACFAGNAGYPLAVFNATGKRLSGNAETTQIDTRGLWYNPVKKQICGNAYSEFGWFSYKINTTGLVGEVVTDLEGKHQPNEQSVGAYNIAKKQVIFLSGSEIWAYNADGTEVETKTTLHWGLTAKDGIAEDEDVSETPEGYNSSTLIYTGLPNAEIGVLNIADKQVELYSSKTGFLSKKLKLPDDATAEATFNFAYANGIYWLFDMENRKWTGYK